MKRAHAPHAEGPYPGVSLPTDVIKYILKHLSVKECWKTARMLNSSYKQWIESIISNYTIKLNYPHHEIGTTTLYHGKHWKPLHIYMSHYHNLTKGMFVRGATFTIYHNGVRIDCISQSNISRARLLFKTPEGTFKRYVVAGDDCFLECFTYDTRMN